MAQITQEKIIKIPAIVFESADTKEDLEDWLMANDPDFIKEIERIRREESGKGVSLEEAKKKWLTNS